MYYWRNDDAGGVPAGETRRVEIPRDEEEWPAGRAAKSPSGRIFGKILTRSWPAGPAKRNPDAVLAGRARPRSLATGKAAGLGNQQKALKPCATVYFLDS